MSIRPYIRKTKARTTTIRKGPSGSLKSLELFYFILLKYQEACSFKMTERNRFSKNQIVKLFFSL